MFAKNMEVSERDSERLKRYLSENFMKIKATQERANAA
jgi:hypothetical protein